MLLQILVLAFGLVVAVKMVIAISDNSSIRIVDNQNPIFGRPQIAANETTDSGLSTGLTALAAGLAVGITGIGAALGLGTAAAAASAAITEKPESFGKLLVLLALIEAIAIYGFVIAFVLVGTI